MVAQKDNSRGRQTNLSIGAPYQMWSMMADWTPPKAPVTEGDTADHGLDVTAADVAFTNATGRRRIRLL